MKVLTLIAAAVLASLGALLITLHYIGWGLALWVGAAVLSQSFIMAAVWRDLSERRPDGAWSALTPSALIASIRHVLTNRL
ncbi:hypothetical protein SNE35_23765 [Paucibacter sp. R3-3]|uniref:Uncharacterized protein n=1 Tax=Roseateles agri TaxID=3098619 RepID=A0ABU5DP90_9BURK|nr:hypothetical protein [Paucibacter sp. R3-3]MDY0747541.1 hypothetical protein [Paucibacter sp. R3-3]